MITMSSRFAAAMSTSHDVVSRFEIWDNAGNNMLYSSLGDGAGCAILDGNVTFNKDSDQRGQCNITIASPNGSLIPRNNTDPITPWGNEIRIFTGVTYPDKTQEFCPLGCYRMNQVQVTENAGAIQIQIQGYDRSYNISRNVVQVYWPDANTIAQLAAFPQTSLGVPWPYVIQTALQNQWGPIDFSDVPANWVYQMNDQVNSVLVLPASGATNASFQAGTDLYSQMRQYARAAGCDLWFDRNGINTFKTDPVYTFFAAGSNPTPVVSFIEGPNATFDQFQRTLTDQSGYNRVIVTGNGNIIGQGQSLTSFVQYNGGTTSNGVLADDNDPKSPTYIGVVDTNPLSTTYGQVLAPGPYGIVTHEVTNNLLVSQQQVNNFAQLTLRLDIGAKESIALNSFLTDPRIEVDDCVMATRQRDGVTNVLYIVSGLTIPITSKQAMSLTVREKRDLT